MVNVAHTLQVFADLELIAVDIARVVKKGGSIWSLLPVLAEMLGAAKDLVAQAPLALPELKDLDAEEAGLLAKATYTLVKSVIDAAKA